MSSIIPTVGRKVWYYEAIPDAGCFNERVPYDATVVFVWNPDSVNLRVTKHSGDVVTRTSIPLRDPSPEIGADHHNDPGGNFATWMPYQMPRQEPVVIPPPVDTQPSSSDPG